jgi:methylmalonyl-CoA/ethylmalonyl-CoA epimerase
VLNQIGQIARAVSDVDRAEKFYEEVLGLRKLYRFGTLVFFDCAGVRLLLDKPEDGSTITPQGAIYFKVPDIILAAEALEKRGAPFVDRPHLIAPMQDHDLWMTFIRDPDGHLVALMMEGPKGYAPISGKPQA